ncbi:hypothetical protein NIES2109_61940 (plasmid) [Nostoc sp. HK-01]|nr:hypothetical protein NIES2109_61940 [Nostoc sp. HK-01]
MQTIEGDYAVLPPLLSREEAAKRLGVATRTLQSYLNIARIFIEEFKEFNHPRTGTLNRWAKLTLWHIESLEKIRDRISEVGIAQTEIELSKGEL